MSRSPRGPGLRRAVISAPASLLLAAIAAVAAAQESDPLALRRKLELLEQVLRRPEFQWRDSEPTIIERIWSWLVQQLLALLSVSAQSNDLLGLILAAVGVAGLLGAVLYVALRLKRQFVPDTDASAADALAQVRDPDEAFASAEAMASQGDYRLALRYLYLSTLLLLDKRGMINYDRTRTNREVLLNLRDRPQLEAVLREIVQIFDRSWYGIQTPDSGTYEQFLGHVQDLREWR